MPEPYLSPDIEATLSQCVTDCTWLSRRGYIDLALELRTEFMREWEFSPMHWNDAVNTLIDYVQRKGETPEVSTLQLQSVLIEVDNSDAS